MLVKRIYIHQNEDKSPDIKIEMNGNFSDTWSVNIDPSDDEPLDYEQGDFDPTEYEQEDDEFAEFYKNLSEIF